MTPMIIERQEIIDLTGLIMGRTEVRPADRFQADLGADSTDLLNILVAIEDKYGLVIDEIQAAAVDSVDDLWRLVDRLASGPPPDPEPNGGR